VHYAGRLQETASDYGARGAGGRADGQLGVEPVRDGTRNRPERYDDRAAGGRQDVCRRPHDVLQGDSGGQVHTAHDHGGSGPNGSGPDPAGPEPRPVPSGPADIGQGGRGEQLRAWLLHGGPAVPGPGGGGRAPVCRVE